MRQFNDIEFEELRQVILQEMKREAFEKMLKQLDYSFTEDDSIQPFDIFVFRILYKANLNLWHRRLLDAILLLLPDHEVVLKIAADTGIAAQEESNLEALVSSTSQFWDSVKTRKKLYRLEQQICRIEVNLPTGPKYGTGFLIGPDLVFTNYHNVDDLINGNITTDKVIARFDYKSVDSASTDNTESIFKGTVHNLVADPNEAVVAHSPYAEMDKTSGPLERPWPLEHLDFAILKLAKPAGRELAGGLTVLPGMKAERRGWIVFPSTGFTLNINDTLIIMQHPEGEPIKLVLEPNAVIGLNPNGQRVRYRANTKKGSSGSPCFNSEWKLVALHHVGDPSVWAPGYNQGIPINLITLFLKKNNQMDLLTFDELHLDPIEIDPVEQAPPAPPDDPDAPFKTVFLNQTAPFIIRSPFDKRMKGMIAKEKIKVVLLKGESRTGLSYSYNFIKHAADKHDVQCVHLPLKTLFSQEGIASSLPLAGYLINKMDIDYTLPDDEEFKLTVFFSSFIGKVNKMEGKFLIFIDDLASFPMTTNCANFIISLAQAVQNDLKNTCLILAGFKDFLPSEILDMIREVPLRSFDEDDLDSFFKTFYATLPEIVDNRLTETEEEFVSKSKELIKKRADLNQIPNVENVGRQVKKYCQLIIDKLEE